MKKTLIAFASIILLSAACWSDDLEANMDEAKYYDNAKVVRIKSVEGEGYVRRSYDEGDEEAVPNLPLFEKDTVGTTDGRLAIYLGRMNTLRLDGDTVAVLEKVPALRLTDLAVRLETGSIYLEIENLDREKGIEVQTPDCGIFLLDKGLYRVNVLGNGATEVIVHEGIAEVSGRDSSRNVRDNQKIVMVRGEVEERPFYFYASDKDDFDRWNEEQNRELGYARYGTSRYLQDGYEDYEYELSRSGRWIYMSEYNSYAWTPYNAGADWMPYANGRWVWNPYYGYVWTSYDPCGWFTHHYGRWHWDYAYGWHWLPSYHWSPAWVSWFWDDNYYGWCPLSRWNRPVVIIDNRWDRHYDYHRGIPRHSRSTIIIRKNELAAPNIQRAAVNKGALGQARDSSIAFRGKAPSERPVLGKVTVINARGKSVTYKQGAVVSSEKYRAQGSEIREGVFKYDAGPGGRVIRSQGSETSSEGALHKKSSTASSRRTLDSSSSSEGSSGGTGFRARSGSSSSSSSTGNTSYRSKSDSSSSSSSGSSSSSSSSSGTARKKKKGESAYFSNTNGGGSITASSGTAAAARYQSRTLAAGRSFAYRSSGAASSSPSADAEYPSRIPARRSLGSFSSNRRGEDSSPDSSYRSSTASEYRSLGGSDRYARDAGSSSGYSSHRRASSSYSGGFQSSAGSHSANSGSSHYAAGGHSSSSGSSSSHRASSSSSSSESSSSRAKKK